MLSAGVKFAYTQSDEISLLITDYDTPVTEALYNGRLCKIQSILAGIATAEFNRLFIPYMLKKVLNNKTDKEYYSLELIEKKMATMKLAKFDCKAWVVPSINDVYAWFLYRQHDCIRNSKQQAAQTYLSHKELIGKTTDEQVELLFNEKGIDWNDYEDGKIGYYVWTKEELERYKKEYAVEPYEFQRNIIDNFTEGEDVVTFDW